MASEHLVVVIPTYGGGDLLTRAIKSVHRSKEYSTLKVSIYVVDNHPFAADKSFALEADCYLNLPSNPGFATACNVGIRLALKDDSVSFVMLLNPDAYLNKYFFSGFEKRLKSRGGNLNVPIIPLIYFDEEIFQIDISSLFDKNSNLVRIIDVNSELRVFNEHGCQIARKEDRVKYLERNDILVIDKKSNTSEIFYSNSTNDGSVNRIKMKDLSSLKKKKDWLIQNAGSEIFSRFSAGDLFTGYLASTISKSLEGPRRAWCGAAVILPINYLKKFGGFDEAFFLYYEDTEFSYRALAHGDTPFLDPKLIVYHRHSSSTGQDERQRMKEIFISRQIFIVRTSGLRYSLAFTLFTLLRRLCSLMFRKTTVKHFIYYYWFEFVYSVSGILKGLTTRTKWKSVDSR
jgi:GT2 family glycosyltransferase